MPALTVRAAASTHPTTQAAPTVRIKVSLRYMLSCPFALAAAFVTAAPVSCNPLRSVVILYTSICSIRNDIKFLPLRGRSRGGRSFHSIPFRSLLFHSAGRRPPAATVVLACACRPGCGLSCFLQGRFCLFLSPPFGGDQEGAWGAQKITPALVRSVRASLHL
jgi:hypothetical protein